MNESSAMLLERDVDRLLVGDCPADALQTLRARASHDRAFSEHVASVREMNATLREHFAPPTTMPDSLRALLDNETNSTLRAPAHRFRLSKRAWLAVAAVLILAISAWQIVNLFAVNDYVRPEWKPMDRVYTDLVAAGFEPDWLCETDEQFVETFSTQFGQGLILQQESGRVDCLGVTYANTLSDHTACVLLRVEGELVLVLVDRVERDSGIPAHTQKGVFIHRKELGKLVLYELSSAFAEEQALSRFGPP